MKTIGFNGVITTISSRSDKSLRLSVVTPELSAKERATFMEYQNINSDFHIKPLDEVAEGEDTVKAKRGEKTASQRLRNVVYALWASKNEAGEYTDEEFQVYYNKTMESFINKVKERLEEYD